MRPFFLFIIFAFLFSFVSSQNAIDYTIPFKYKTHAIKAKYVNIGIIVPNQVSDYSFFSGIPIDIPTFRIYSVTIDTSAPQESNNTNLFYFYVGLDKSKGVKYLIVDTDINLDFRDDKLYEFSLEDYNIESYTQEQYALCPEIQINYKDVDQNEFLIDLVFNPFYSDKNKNNYPSEDDYFLDCGVFTNSYLQGIFKLDNHDIVINENKLRHTDSLRPEEKLNQKSNFRIFILNDTVFPQNSRIGDTISVVNKKIYLKEVRENKLVLQDLGELSDSSRVGAYLPDLYSACLSDNKIIYLNDLMKGKFVFIDFWGSWCNPCIASIPKLKALHNKIKGRTDILMLGVALEEKEELEKLKKIIKEYFIEWTNVWSKYSDRKLLTSIHGKLMIDQFPTYMIIDKDGKIVYKKNRMYNTQDAIDSFMNLINE